MCIIIIDVAEEVLNKCVIGDPTKKEDDKNYNVLFSYEFIEDFRDPEKLVGYVFTQKFILQYMMFRR